jgi:phage gp36-like protein
MTLPASYCTMEQVVGRYPPIGSSTAVTSAQIADLIGTEQAIIDGRLASRYTVPFSPVPPLIEAICGDLAALRLVSTRLIKTGDEDVHEIMTARWKHSAELLDQLACGSLYLPTGSGTILGDYGPGEVLSNVSAVNTPTFIGQPFEDVYGPDSYRR